MEELKPAITLNVFVEPYFRSEILQKVFDNLGDLPAELRREVIAEVKDKVRISGFRNAMVAPRSLLVRDAESMFEKDTKFTLIILKCWNSLYSQWHETLRKALISLGFAVSESASQNYPDPMNAFLEGWPEGLDFDTLYEKVPDQIKDFPLNKDETALLSILLTGYLP